MTFDLLLGLVVGVLVGLVLAIVWYRHSLKSNPEKIAKLLAQVDGWEATAAELAAKAKALADK